MITRQTSLSKNLVRFCRFLRVRGFSLSVEEEALALNALQYIDFTKQGVFRLALIAVLCRSQKELHEFDELFNEYWKEWGRAIDSKVKTKPALNKGKQQASFTSLKSWLNGNRNKETELVASYSIHETLSQKDLSTIPLEEVDELMQIIKALSKRLAARLMRRYQATKQVKLPDLRKTLRKNMRHGGELLELAFKKPKRNRTDLVVLCDVSKSMDLYATFLLQFLYAFQQVYRTIETFAFSTSLQRITPQLKENSFAQALISISTNSHNWSGGTRIGDSLADFTDQYASRFLHNGTTIIILSDGWYTFAIALLEKSLELIKRKSKKVIWLNPLAGYASYSPDVAGMKAAMPYIDVFAPVHNLESLKKLVSYL